MQKQILSLADVQKAHARIQPLIVRTPVLTNAELNDRLGARLFFKCENLQKTGSFKYRGASNAVAELIQAPSPPSQVVTHSSGNHGSALACAAGIQNLAATVVMPHTAPKAKQENVRRYGAKIVFCEPTLAARQSAVEQILMTEKAALVHPYNDFTVMAGQGTAALELISDYPGLEMVLTPVGGGGLLSGTAAAAKGLQPKIKIIGVEPAVANDQQQSFRVKKRITIPDPDTIADGLRTPAPGEIPFASICHYVDDILTVSEATIRQAMRLIWDHLKIIVEPSGAVPLGTLLEHRSPLAGKKIGIILSGGNLDLDSWKWEE